MELRSLLPQNESSIRKPLSSFTLSMVGAVSAELILGSFLDAVTWTHAFGRIGIIAVALFVIHRFALESLYAYKPRIKDLITLTCVLLGSITFVALGKIVCLSVHTYASVLNLPVLNLMASEIGSQGLYYAIPFSAGGILVQAIMGIEFALVFGMGLALIVGVYLPEDITLPAFVIATAFVGSLGMLRVRSRQAYIKAGVNVAIITLVFSLARIALKEHANIMIVLTAVGVSIIGGILTTFVISGIAPAIEKLGGYVTDISLLEIATLDHPLLKQLSVQAPGTWNHSMVMGMMVESAAQAINANPVLGRVACYYHDVGKSKNPLYFIENQGRGENRHDKLSPSMSALIIKAHVKDGIKMAEEARLPQAIIDMIPQHHGTSLIEYFYDKACKEAAEANSGKEVDETVYRYPGPRPQTKEAGIIMLADGIEAACRTISEPTMDRIQGLVQKMVNKVFASGELEECELTLRELHEIAKCFTRVLTGIYHSRISYSEPAEKTAESEAQIINTADTTKTEPNESHSDKKDGESSSPEDLKRLGI